MAQNYDEITSTMTIQTSKHQCQTISAIGKTCAFNEKVMLCMTRGKSESSSILLCNLDFSGIAMLSHYSLF